MIPKEQLRINNLVILAHESNAPIATIQQLKNRGAVVDVGGKPDYTSYDLLLPIDLNEHWLERLGFHWDEVTWSHEYVLLAPFKHGFMVYYGTLTYGKCKVTIKDVHALQNFMFAITGKELTLKEPVNEA
jgi:hypothetical protein